MKLDANQLADEVGQAWVCFMKALSDKRKYPAAEFKAFFSAVKGYAEATAEEHPR